MFPSTYFIYSNAVAISTEVDIGSTPPSVSRQKEDLRQSWSVHVVLTTRVTPRPAVEHPAELTRAAAGQIERLNRARSHTKYTKMLPFGVDFWNLH